jgi:hypothetical protein
LGQQQAGGQHQSAQRDNVSTCPGHGLFPPI